MDHLQYLLGFNDFEKRFKILPSALRSSPIFNAFLWNLQQLLDQNYDIGIHLLPITLYLLHFAPIPNDSFTEYYCEYTLGALEPHQRQFWLMTLLVILYKV